MQDIWKKFHAVLTGIYILEKLVLFIGMDCRTPTAITFRTKLEFNQHDLIMTKEQSVFKGKNMIASFCFKLKN